MTSWSEFYKNQRIIAWKAQQTKAGQEESDVATQWKACVEAHCARGGSLEEVRCALDKPVQRQALDEMQTSALPLVIHKTNGWYDQHSGESGGPYWTLRVARPGLLGVWDRLWDYSK